MSSSNLAPDVSQSELPNPTLTSTTVSNITTVAGSKPTVEMAATAYLDHQAYVQGTFPISLGADVIVHPRARLLSFSGPVSIGAGTVVSERCIIGGGRNPLDPRGPAPTPPQTPLETVIGRDVMLHASAEVEAGALLEDACLVEPRAVVRERVRLGRSCKVCAAALVDRSVGDWVVVLGHGQQRRLRRGAEDSEYGRLRALKKEREAIVGLLKAAAAKATLGKRRG